jgi:hypothetical protein
MKLRNILVVSLSGLVAWGSVGATPVTMDYTKTSLGGGQFKYELALTLDNHDSSWRPANNGTGSRSE